MTVATKKPRTESDSTHIKWGGHNRKLGPGIYSYSTPAVDTCPGRTPLCSRACYALKGYFVFASRMAAQRAARAAADSPRFAGLICRAIAASGVRVLRVHVSGDFDTAAYTRAWGRVAARCPQTAFFAYTRSWRVPALLPVLLELAALPNFQLIWSEDRDTGPSPRVPGVLTAFLVADAGDEALLDPTRHDLAFRDQAHRKVASGLTPRKWLRGVWVCPAEQWPVRAKRAEGRSLPHVTCTKCRYCFARVADGKARAMPTPTPPG